MSKSEYKKELISFRDKYGFIDPIDTLMILQPRLKFTEKQNYQDTINLSLFNFINSKLRVKMKQSEFDNFYYDPSSTVSFYNYLFEFKTDTVIQNGIKI